MFVYFEISPILIGDIPKYIHEELKNSICCLLKWQWWTTLNYFCGEKGLYKINIVNIVFNLKWDHTYKNILVLFKLIYYNFNYLR